MTTEAVAAEMPEDVLFTDELLSRVHERLLLSSPINSVLSA